MIRRPPRIAVLGATLVATGAWIAVNPQQPADATQRPITEAVHRDEAPPRVVRAFDVSPALPVRERLAKLGRDPFSRPAGMPRPAVPAPKPMPVALPPPPPPFPFHFIGQVWLPSGTQVVLGRGNEAYAAKEGDALDGQYRVEKIGATEIVVVHLPTATRSVIQFGIPGG